MTPFWTATITFAVSYLLIVSEKVDRTVVALGGAVVLVVAGVLDQERAVGGVDFNTIGLLIGMMVIVAIARRSGMFQYVALQACRVGRGRALPIFVLLGLVTAVFSAVLDNVTTVLLLTPVLFIVTNNLGVQPMPWLIGTILLSNVGGMGTLIGDPPNIMIGSAAGLSFNAFLVNLGPAAVLISLATVALLVGVYHRDLVSSPEAAERILAFRPADAIEDRGLLLRSLGVLALVLVGFFTHGSTGLEGATIALGGATLLLLLTRQDPEEILHDVEWNTLFFFAGLFMLVAGLEEVGAIQLMASALLEATGGDPTTTTLALLWGAAIASAIVDNIPFVATMIPLVHDIGQTTTMDVEPLWWALALGADIGGNATIVGASANVVVAGLAARSGHPIGFFQFMRVALPLTVIGVVLAHVYVWLRYL